jgi:hypothetical protein
MNGFLEAHWSSTKHMDREKKKKLKVLMQLNTTSRALGFKTDTRKIHRHDDGYLVVGRVRLMPFTKN